MANPTQQQPTPEAKEVRPSGDISVREKQATREQGTHEGRYFEPAVDIHETDTAIVVSADVPGASANDIETDLRDNLLTFVARVQPLEERWKPVYREYQLGHYQRQFRLGQQIDQGKITAVLRDGVLTLTLPKADHARPRKIQISAQ